MKKLRNIELSEHPFNIIIEKNEEEPKEKGKKNHGKNFPNQRKGNKINEKENDEMNAPNI